MDYYSLLKTIDNRFGSVLCQFFSIFYKNDPGKPIAKNPRVLVIKFWGMGTILLSTHALRNIKEHLSPSEFILLTLDKNREFCESLGLFSTVLSCQLWPLPVFIFQIMKNILYLRRKKIDIVFDFEFFTHFSALITFLVGGKKNVGFYAGFLKRGNFYHVRCPFNMYWHIYDTFLNLVKMVIPEAEPFPLSVPPIDDAIIEKQALIRKRYIVMNPNSDPIGLQRRWPSEYFVRLITHLSAAYAIPVVFIGTAAEAGYNEAIVRQIPQSLRVMNLAGKTTIRELSALLRHAAIVITNDSGPLHLAVALNTPTISFFGPETPSIFGPRGNQHTIFYKNLDCSPCMNVHRAKEIYCTRGKADCLLMITPDKVVEATVKILDQRLGRA